MRAWPFLLLPVAALAGHPAGTELPTAVAVDITPDGFNSLTAIAASLIPTGVDIPDVYLAGAEETCIIWCWNWYEYEISTSGLGIDLALSRFRIIPRNGYLDLDVAVSVSVASANDPGNLYAFGEVIDLISVEESCDVWLNPTEIAATTRIDIGLDQGVVDVNVRPIDVNIDLRGLRIEDCTFAFVLDLIDVLDDILGVFGFDLYALIGDAIEPVVEGQINRVLPALERTLEDALGALDIATEVPLLDDTSLLIDVHPDVLTVEPAGLRLGLAGAIAPTGRPAPCVSRLIGDGSLATPGAAPAIGDGPAGHHLGLHVDDDLLNQALWSTWYAGLLCQTIDGDAAAGLGLPIPIDTSLLKLLAPGAFDDLFPTSGPLVMVTRPAQPPTALIDGAHLVDVAVDELGLDLYAGLDGRLTRVAGFELTVDAGIDLDFDGADGTLAVGVDLPEDAIGVALTFADLNPSAGGALEQGLAGIVGTVVGPLIGGLTSDLAFPIPSFSGLGVQSLSFGGSGPAADHLGGWGNVGPVAYALPEGASCTDGCDAGCSSSPAVGAWGFALAAWATRRRRARSRR